MVNHPEVSDRELIERCRRGDQQAFDVLYYRYRLPLFGYLNKLLPGNAALVDDVFQQVWCKVLRKWDCYGDQQRFLAWICRIAHNLIIDIYRKNRCMNSDEITEAEAVSTDESSHDLLMQKELWDDLERAIEALPKKQREVVECRRQGKSFQDIAHFQKSSVNTVLGRMHYAVKKLRDSLREHMV